MKFDYNSPLMEFINTTAHYAVLNIIFILCCLPIITIGPAIAALYQVIMRESRGEQGYLIRNFFKNFKEMFVQAIFTSVILFAILFILIFNVIFWSRMGGLLSNLIMILLFMLLFLVVCAGIYVFPLMARFKNSFMQTIRNAFFIALANLKATFFLIMIHVITISMLSFFAPSKIFMLLIGFSFVAYCNSYILDKVFKNYETNEDAIQLTQPPL